MFDVNKFVVFDYVKSYNYIILVLVNVGNFDVIESLSFSLSDFSLSLNIKNG